MITKTILACVIAACFLLGVGPSYEQEEKASLRPILRDTCIGKTIDGLKQGYWQCWIDGQYRDRTYVDDYLHGVERVYRTFKGEKLYILLSYENGFRQGQQVSYYPNEKPHYITTYEKGRYTRTVELDTAGYVIMQGEYIVDSVEVDVTKLDSQTYEIVSVTKRKDLRSIKDGVWSFYENGRLTKEYVYERGEVIDSLVVGR